MKLEEIAGEGGCCWKYALCAVPFPLPCLTKTRFLRGAAAAGAEWGGTQTRRKHLQELKSSDSPDVPPCIQGCRDHFVSHSCPPPLAQCGFVYRCVCGRRRQQLLTQLCLRVTSCGAAALHLTLLLSSVLSHHSISPRTLSVMRSPSYSKHSLSSSPPPPFLAPPLPHAACPIQLHSRRNPIIVICLFVCHRRAPLGFRGLDRQGWHTPHPPLVSIAKTILSQAEPLSGSMRRDDADKVMFFRA